MSESMNQYIVDVGHEIVVHHTYRVDATSIAEARKKAVAMLKEHGYGDPVSTEVQVWDGKGCVSDIAGGERHEVK